MRRKRTRVGLVALVAAVAWFAASACTKQPTPPPPPPSSASPSATPAPDLVVQGVSVRAAWDKIKSEFGIGGDLEIVPLGQMSRACGKKGEVIDGSLYENADAVYVCTDGRLAVAEAFIQKMSGQPIAVVWYYLGAKVAIYQPGFNGAEFYCAGGFIARRSPTFQAGDVEKVQEYVLSQDNAPPGADAFVLAGANNAVNPNTTVRICAGAG